MRGRVKGEKERGRGKINGQESKAERELQLEPKIGFGSRKILKLALVSASNFFWVPAPYLANYSSGLLYRLIILQLL